MAETYDISVDKSALNRILTLRSSQEGNFNETSLLRVSVEGGGCSGFQYKIEPADDGTINDDDIIIEGAVVIDEVSAQYLKGATIKFQDDLMSAMFVVDNPGATSSCGCQASFAIDPDKIG